MALAVKAARRCPWMKRRGISNASSGGGRARSSARLLLNQSERRPGGSSVIEQDVDEHARRATVSDRQHLKCLVTEAKVYREQGLLAQSREKYLEALEILGRMEGDPGRETLRTALGKALEDVEQELEGVDQGDVVPELSQEMKGLIRKLFSFSEDRAIADYKGAVALARFGQYGEALEEFNRLMDRGTMAAVAAKNILTCHLAFASPDVAISQYERWISGTQLRREELEDIRLFLEKILDEEGVDTRLPRFEDLLQKRESCGCMDEDELPVTGVRIPRGGGVSRANPHEFDVFLHLGRIVSIHIPPDRRNVLGEYQLGSRINGMKLFSTMAVFEGNGLVIGKKRIESGPREGHYALDIHVEAV
jgi:tetratricopeptide (TPR) repeat protein